MREIDTPLGHVFMSDGRPDPKETPLRRTENVTYYAGTEAYWTFQGAADRREQFPVGRRPEVFKQTIIRETLVEREAK